MESFLIAFAINLLIAEVAFALQKAPKGKKYSLSDIQVPTATEDRAQGYGAGVFTVAGNIIDHGNFRSVVRTKKIKSLFGLFSKKQPIGTEIYLTTWQTLCGVTCDRLLEIKHGDKTIWRGDLELSKTAPTSLRLSYRYAESELQDLPDGMDGTFTFFNHKVSPGTAYSAPLANPVIASLRGLASNDLPGYPNTLHCVFDGMVGINPSLKPLTFVLARQPDLSHLLQPGVMVTYPVSGDLGDPGVKSQVEAFIAQNSSVSGDANPALVELEVLTTHAAQIGPQLNPSTVNLSSYFQAAKRLRDEDIGVSFGWALERPISELMKDLMLLAYSTRETLSQNGQLAMRLVREDDPVMATFNASNIIQVESVKRMDPVLAPNVVQVPFVDRNAQFVERLAIAKNPAAAQATKKTVDTTVQLIGVSRPELAAMLASREQRKYASSLVTTTFQGFAPEGVLLKPLHLISFEHPVTKQVQRLRVASVKYETGISSQRVSIEAVEDLFRNGFGDVVLSLPPAPPVDSRVTASLTDAVVVRAPYALHGDDQDVAMYYANSPQSNTTRYQAAIQSTFSTTAEWSNEAEADYDESLEEPAIKASLVSALAATDTGSAGVVFNLSEDNARRFAGGERSQIYVVIDGEWLSCSSWSLTGTQLKANTIMRGVLDTNPARHQAGAAAYILLGYSLLPETLSDGKHVIVRAESRGQSGSLDPNLAVASEARLTSQLTGRSIAPLPARRVTVQGTVGNPSAESAETVPFVSRLSSYQINWSNRNRLTRRAENWYSTDQGNHEPGTVNSVKLSCKKADGTFVVLGDSGLLPEATSSHTFEGLSLPAGELMLLVTVYTWRPGSVYNSSAEVWLRVSA